jgi:hypothetical protein
LDHCKRSEQVGAPIGRKDDERQLLKRTIQALLAEGATLLDAIEEAALVVRATLDTREGGLRQPVDGDPPSGVRDVSADLAGSEPCSERWSEAART